MVGAIPAGFILPSVIVIIVIGAAISAIMVGLIFLYLHLNRKFKESGAEPVQIFPKLNESPDDATDHEVEANNQGNHSLGLEF